MDLSKTPEEPKKETRKPLGYKCSADGVYFAFFKRKICSYCLPVYDQEEVNKIKKGGSDEPK